MKIVGYHLHVYCTAEQIPLAQNIRQALLRDLPQIQGAGPVRNRPVGPHPLPMFEAWFEPEHFEEVKNWISAHRQGLSVLFHPITGDDYLDHAEGAIWIGEPVPLNLEVLKH